MKVIAICRGAPGLGRVVPALALTQTLAESLPVTVTFATYGAGIRYLSARREYVVDLGQPDGLFIDSVAPQALSALRLIEDTASDLVVVDGEFFLPATLAHLEVPMVYLANPHDVIGPPNPFRRVNRLLLSHADAVLISSLTCPKPVPWPGLIPGTPCLEVPAIIKNIPLAYHRAAGPPRVLVSTGGGSLRCDGLRAATYEALGAVLEVLAMMTGTGQAGTVSVVLGADAAIPRSCRPSPGWLRVIEQPAELADLYPHHDLLIARAGRNITAEAAYCGIPAVLFPVTADNHRAAEQTGNAGALAHLPGVFAIHDWHDPAAVRHTLSQALATARHGIRRTGRRGNDDAAAFVAGLVGSSSARHLLTTAS
jgi:UDP:flavonoid glycosyltransferase YjiC (YdhE family)